MKESLVIALSHAGFADKNEDGLWPCKLGTFVREGSDLQSKAECEDCPPGNYPKMNFVVETSYFVISRPIALCFMLQYFGLCFSQWLMS